MKSKDIIGKFVSYFDKAESFALLCHVNPDSDTLGSALALRLALIKCGKKANVFCDDNPPSRLAFLPTVDVVNSTEDINKKYDVCIAVDCSDAERFNVSGKYFKHARVKLVIDHHKTNTNFADYTVCDADAGATAQIMYDVLSFMEEKYSIKIFDYDVATLLFSAIVGDTGAFAFDNTTSETFAVASRLMEFGVRSRDIIYAMIKSQGVDRYRLKARALIGSKFYDDDKIGIMTFTAADFNETGTSTDFTEGIINELIDVLPVQIAFAVSEVGNKYYKVSVRTKEPYDASSIASVFGGGGHDRAAGLRISGYYEDVLDKLLKAARDVL